MPPSRRRGDPHTSTPLGVWGTFIAGSWAWIVGALMLVEGVTPRNVVRTIIAWLVAAALNVVAIRTALYRSPPEPPKARPPERLDGAQ
jgi:hypothetical protein